MTESKKLDVILFKLDSIENEIKETKEYIGNAESRLDEKIDSVESRLGARIDSVESRLGARIDSVESHLGARIDDVEKDVKSIKLTIENEIRPNIQRIAEGHLDVSRHLHDVMDAKEELETLTVKVNILETAVRESNRKIS